MSTVEDITALFTAASAAFPPITGPPTDDDVVNLREALLTVLFSVQLVGSEAGCPSGVILDDQAYMRTTGANSPFDAMRGPIPVFNPAIASTTKEVVLQKKMAI